MTSQAAQKDERAVFCRVFHSWRVSIFTASYRKLVLTRSRLS